VPSVNYRQHPRHQADRSLAALALRAFGICDIDGSTRPVARRLGTVSILSVMQTLGFRFGDQQLPSTGIVAKPRAVARGIHDPRRTPQAARTMPVTGLYLNLAMAWPTAETVLIISLMERTTRIPRMADRACDSLPPAVCELRYCTQPKCASGGTAAYVSIWRPYFVFTAHLLPGPPYHSTVSPSPAPAALRHRIRGDSSSGLIRSRGRAECID
jgi:hypothetical protein